MVQYAHQQIKEEEKTPPLSDNIQINDQDGKKDKEIERNETAAAEEEDDDDGILCAICQSTDGDG